MDALILALIILILLMALLGFGVSIFWLYHFSVRKRSAQPVPGAASSPDKTTPPEGACSPDSSETRALQENTMNNTGPAPEPEQSSPSRNATRPFLRKVPFAETPSSGNFDIMRSASIRFAVVALVMLALLIPIGFIRTLVNERAALYSSVVSDISSAWGGSQNVAGPLLIVPFTELYISTATDPENSRSVIRSSEKVLRHMVILPRSVRFDGVLDPEERTRGIYRSLVYTAELDLNGLFTLPTREEWLRAAPALHSIDYQHAYIVMGLTWPNALRSVSPFLWNGEELRPEPGTLPTRINNGFRVPVSVDPGKTEYGFSQKLSFNGSMGLRITPVGEVTELFLSSPWPSPSFQGQVLPAAREVSAEGFRASWNIPSLARSFPNFGVLEKWPENFTEFQAGVDLFESGGHYQLVQRAVKYAALFIGLTFLAYIVLDLGMQARLHPVQYGLVGMAMVVFYLSLLSLTEHVPFGPAYAAASACAILMISIYTAAALRAARFGLGAGLLLTAIYALLYTILQMEDYALLMGTGLVLIMLGALMYVSRSLNRSPGR
ncbi:MAG TPA: cell envelope integrity protein CreD [Candidatus Mailhella merdavium]|nr:cell envelope integrity protein CreD [Candidatus Mailhella merdavium]